MQSAMSSSETAPLSSFEEKTILFSSLSSACTSDEKIQILIKILAKKYGSTAEILSFIQQPSQGFCLTNPIGVFRILWKFQDGIPLLSKTGKKYSNWMTEVENLAATETSGPFVAHCLGWNSGFLACGAPSPYSNLSEVNNYVKYLAWKCGFGEMYADTDINPIFAEKLDQAIDKEKFRSIFAEFLRPKDDGGIVPQKPQDQTNGDSKIIGPSVHLSQLPILESYLKLTKNFDFSKSTSFHRLMALELADGDVSFATKILVEKQKYVLSFGSH
jgi:hypothetical protein